MSTLYGATPFANYKMTLQGESWTGDWKNRSQWNLDIVNNNPRLVVWPRNPKEDGKKTEDGRRELKKLPISMLMGAYDLMALLALMETKIIPNPDQSMFEMHFKGRKYDAGGNPVAGEIEVKSKLVFGRDADGVIYFIASEKGRDKPVYKFKGSDWTPVLQNGADIPIGLNSNLAAQGFIDAVRTLFGPVMTKFHIPEVKEGKTDTPVSAVTDAVADW